MTQDASSFEQDERFMREALSAALRGRFSTSPNPRVGCVFARDGVLLATGFHSRRGGPHAEADAIAAAGRTGTDLAGSTCYVTLEPCSHFGTTPPCAGALIDARVARVVAAGKDPNPLVSGKGFEMLRAAGVSVSSGVLEEEARQLNPGFFRRMQSNLPYCRVKVAASIDGRTALANGQSRWITGPVAREEVHRLRALSCAVVTGSGTVLADDPLLTVRSRFVSCESDAVIRQPLRVVAGGKSCAGSSGPADASPQARRLSELQVFDTALAPTVMAAGSGVSSAEREALKARSVVVRDDIAMGSGRIDLEKLLQMLAGEYQCNEVLVEAGSELASAFIRQNFCDELWWYTGSILMGAESRPAFGETGALDMSEVGVFDLIDLVSLGNDIRALYRPSDSAAPKPRYSASAGLYQWTKED